MKKLCLFLSVLLLLAGCGSVENEPASTFEPTATIAVAETEPEMVLSHEIAMLEGYVLMDEGDVRHNAGSWVKFLDACEAGEAASVTVVSFVLEDAGYTYTKYDLAYDGSVYTLIYSENGAPIQVSSSELVYATGMLDDSQEPYDAFEQYSLNDVVIYRDLIAQPDFEGVNEIHLHAKEGESPIKTYSSDAMQPVLELLWNAEYVPSEPENYIYGMKLLMTNRDGKELVIELELNQGYYRYGMQNYCYGEVPDLFTALGIDQWPDSVLSEFGDFVK